MSEATPLNLPRLTRAGVRSQNRLAGAHHYPFTLGDESGALYILPGTPQQSVELSHWRCALGAFSLANAAPLLNLLSQCPLPAPGANPPDSDWQWALFNQYLSPELALLLGELQPDEPAQDGEVNARLHVRLGDRHAECPLRFGHAQLAHWLSQPGWQSSRTKLAGAITYSQPLVLGRITLCTEQLQALTAGDLLIPPVSYFTPDGQGSLTVAGQRLYGELQLPHHFLLNHLESTALNSADDDALTEGSLPEYTGCEDNPQLASLPLSLEVRCGRTALTLGELQRLQAGSVVTLDNVTPGEAGLYHGDTLIARGELVDVEGHLGLQLTQLLLTSCQEVG
ncbi:FliM/FliN family flagellar motor switch protein [Erwinia amylovora]|uniref:Type III secretion protein HrcQa n=3 Tax=Erwinia amylovora TaxID=552 RepID=D4HVM2_ERWAC|nr:FliM/FliN family flagellar motor switch protein [Erwinia amylovora]CDK14129.1 Type III secretion protein HrcQa [Erwinia amylovora LA635]CDK17496.1 Type III secretion protein HrcQa [Erwinia amylovora LA636]CDK20865.1 Type III secretion protein HrcQa [Erwinia amylovora LA637]AAB06004.2 HrcQ [Erwinia amylovora]ATZ12647.1 YscQ/HrcQ family type III secretion apparatus protein [Erwinia amylovora]